MRVASQFGQCPNSASIGRSATGPDDPNRRSPSDPTSALPQRGHCFSSFFGVLSIPGEVKLPCGAADAVRYACSVLLPTTSSCVACSQMAGCPSRLRRSQDQSANRSQRPWKQPAPWPDPRALSPDAPSRCRSLRRTWLTPRPLAEATIVLRLGVAYSCPAGRPPPPRFGRQRQRPAPPSCEDQSSW
jgi:hypothetical protein